MTRATLKAVTLAAMLLSGTAQDHCQEQTGLCDDYSPQTGLRDGYSEQEGIRTRYGEALDSRSEYERGYDAEQNQQRLNAPDNATKEYRSGFDDGESEDFGEAD